MHKEKGSQHRQLNAPTELGSDIANLKTAYKVKDLIHNSQKVDKEILGVDIETLFNKVYHTEADAVERGDMETAGRLVMEAAEKVGFINDESWRKNHRAPRKDEENSNPFNTEKIVPELPQALHEESDEERFKRETMEITDKFSEGNIQDIEEV